MTQSSKLRQHQIEGAQWLLAHPHGYLADAPRVGKTRTLLAAFQQSGSESGLIVVPAMVKSHWIKEARLMGIPDEHIDIVSYDKIVRDNYDPTYSDILILDEAHFLKNVSSKRTKKIFGRGGLARIIPVVWPASGTPIPKNPSEIFSDALGALSGRAARGGVDDTSGVHRSLLSRVFCVPIQQQCAALQDCRRQESGRTEAVARAADAAAHAGGLAF